jgi:hypothetical protein
MDLAIVIIGGIIILPFLLVIALLVKITSPGKVLYGHKRIGKNGYPDCPINSQGIRKCTIYTCTFAERAATQRGRVTKFYFVSG